MRTDLIEKATPLPYLAKSRVAMGQKAAEDIAIELRQRLQNEQGVRMIFAAAPSQSEMSPFSGSPGSATTLTPAAYFETLRATISA